MIRPAAEETTALVNYLAHFIAKDTKVPYPLRHVFFLWVIDDPPVVTLTPD